MKVSYKNFTTILNNIVNMSDNKIQDYALKVSYVADTIFESKGYSVDARFDLFMLNLVKYATQPAKLLFEEALNDIVNAASTKNYAITKGIMDYCTEFNNLPLWKSIIKNQNVTYSNYTNIGRPIDFPTEIFTMRFAEKIVLASESLKNLDNMLNDFVNNSKEDIIAFQKADYKYNIFNKLKSNEYMNQLLVNVDKDVPMNIKLGILKLVFIVLDFKHLNSICHTAIIYKICKFIAEKINLNSGEAYILEMCSYIAKIGSFAGDMEIDLNEEPTKEEMISIINQKIIGINEAFRNVSILNYRETLCKQFEYNDGSGFPLGLNSNDLNLYSKILTIANRFCVLYEDTKYCKGTSIDNICDILKHDSACGRLEERYVSVILNNKQEFFSEISNIIMARKQLYNQLIAGEKTKEIQNYSSLNILVVEDSDLDWLVFSKTLSVFKIKPARATNGRIALEMINKNKKYDIIFMDIQMPDMDGHEATKAIRALKDKDKAFTPIYAVTADAYSGSITTCINSGMNGHFSKPIDTNRLVKILEHIYLNK